MSSFDSRIDTYIEKAAPFAQPILQHLRDLVHTHCPDTVETVKWGMPFFDYNGKGLFHIAAFKQHCACGFWFASLMKDPKGLLQTTDKSAMGSLGKITSLADLPSGKIMADFIRDAMQLIDSGVKLVKAAPKKAEEPEVPGYFMEALKKNKKALAVFEKFAPSHRKEYLEWVMDAKREETRNKRMAEAISWMAEGKARHWKYERS